MFNVFDTVVFSDVNTTLELSDPVNQIIRNDALDPVRFETNDAGFGAVEGAKALHSVQLQVRFAF